MSPKAVIATEIEFYLYGSRDKDLASFWQAVRASGLDIYAIEKEKGEEQHEVALAPQRETNEIIRQTDALKALVTELALRHGMRADFSAKPMADQPGSGLHVHVHLEDAEGNNLYTKKDAEISDALKHSIGGLLATMKEHMHIFAPTEASRARFVAASEAPTTLSWGANNRTVAVRLPDTGVPEKRIEHRVAGADADVRAVVEAVLAGIAYGLENTCDPGPQIYGDASLPMYGLPKLLD